MKKIKLNHGILLTLLALVFTLGLTFASVELPRLVDTLLHKNIDFLDVATGQDELTAYKTELFLSHYHIRLIGYISLGLILALIITGFVFEKRKLASVGAVILFLPVFGHFAATMFFLGGLAFLRFLWLPFLDISFDIMRLGDIVLLLSAFSSGLIGLPGKKFVASEPYIDKLVHTIKTTGSRTEIRNAAVKLAEIDGVAVDSLIELLGHENVFIRWYCADALGSVKSEKIVKPLLKLLDDPDQTVRRMAAGSLGKSGSSEAVQPLINALLDSAKGIQSDAARALGVLGAQDAIQPLIKILQSENQTTSRWAAWALGEIGAKEAIDPLIYCLEEREDCDYYQVGMALRKLDSNRSVDAFIAGMVKGAGWAQSACATALGESRSEKAIDPLINALKEGSEQVRRAAVFALQNFKAEKVITALKAATKDSDLEVRMYAREALKKIDFQVK